MTVNDFTVAIAPFYEMMLFCTQLILCFRTPMRKHGLIALMILSCLYILPPWFISKFHKLSFFMIGEITIGHLIMAMASIAIFFGCFRISWQRAFLQEVITTILQFLWFVVSVQLYISVPGLQPYWLKFSLLLQIAVYLLVAVFFRKAISWDQADHAVI